MRMLFSLCRGRSRSLTYRSRSGSGGSAPSAWTHWTFSSPAGPTHPLDDETGNAEIIARYGTEQQGVRAAADERRGPVPLGLELAGTGRRHHDDEAGILGDWRHRSPNSEVHDLLWQPSRLYADDVVGGARIASRSPAYEGTVARSWIDTFPQLAPLIRVPVHHTLGEHERVWNSGSSALADIASLFTASPRVAVDEQSTNRRAADTT